MKLKIKFKDFPTGNESGIVLISPFWLEHLLNLFFQGYISEFQMEIWDTQNNNCKSIENWAYGIIGQEFSKKHLPKIKEVKK